MVPKQDLFIGHADADKQRYILPLAKALTDRGITFWLDDMQIGWGDNFVLKINEGLRKSLFTLICLSENFLGRGWPENELTAALAIQNKSGLKKVLLLILNAKNKIFQTYPILASLSYREFSAGLDAIVEELAILTKKEKSASGLLRVVVESVHTDKLCNLSVPRRASVKWLAEKARTSAGLSEAADVGALTPFRIRWVLVDIRAEDEWECTPFSEKVKIKALVKSKAGIKTSYRYRDRLEDLDIYDGIVFHLYALQDADQDDSKGGGGGTMYWLPYT